MDTLSPYALAATRRDSGLPPPNWLDNFLVVWSVSIFEGGYTPFVRFLTGHTSWKETDVGTDYYSIGFQFIIFFILAYRYKTHYELIKPFIHYLKPFMYMLGFLTFTALWASDPVLTVRRCSIMATAFAITPYMLAMFGGHRTIALACVAGWIMILTSILLYFLVPSVGVDNDLYSVGAMRGVFSQKNDAGEVFELVLAQQIYLFCARPKFSLGLLLGIFFVYFTSFMVRSGTTEVACTLGLVLGFIGYFAIRRPTRPLAYLMLVASVVGGVLIVTLFSNRLLEALGKSGDFTGRTELWAIVWPMIAEKPWFGWGLYGFWRSGSVATQYVWSLISWEPPNAHNGYLDTLLQLGIIGTLIYVATILPLFKQVFAAFTRNTPFGWWAFLWVAMFLVHNNFESMVPTMGSDTMWFTFTYALLRIEEEKRVPQASVSSRTEADSAMLAGHLVDVGDRIAMKRRAEAALLRAARPIEQA